MRATKHWVREVTVSILAFGLAATALTVQAASDDSLPTALGSAQPTGVVSTPSGEKPFLPEANILMAPPLLNSCCVPVTTPVDGEPKFYCRVFNPKGSPPFGKDECRAKQGIPTSGCYGCPSVLRSGNTEGEVDTMGDDSPATEPADSSPLNTGAGSIWALLVVTMFVAGL
jgi:hypothetical protein